ncbi:DNA-binding transcriptional LysR family regulator [Rubrivivax gelatinosus]|uniref:DNA-binding transcriptional LysR family regulator n=2 Tax=Rubrivivax gelatinosus TaxID=28068 RepID=A0A4R2M534_RUBGE|nr:DNA-binding transcriptional LysR family regulator [Rubrivivax gelatinosus]
MTNNARDAGPLDLANLKRLAYFAAVVETGSFTAAAERLGITKAVVSQQVARLEREFRTSLLTRTTRRLALTDAGQAFHERCARILREAAVAFDELAGVSVEPAGTLRLTAPFDYGLACVVPAVVEFSRRYPQCRVELALSDQSLDLLSNEVELAVRVGWLPDSPLPARRIGSFEQTLVATPALARRLDPAAGPQQLAQLPFVANAALKEPRHWVFEAADGRRQAVEVQPSISLDATLAVLSAVSLGAGVSVLPDYTVAQALAEGRLVALLPGWTLPAGGIHAVYPASRFRPAKVARFVDLLAELHAGRA